VVDLINVYYKDGFRLTVVEGPMTYSFKLTPQNLAGLLSGIGHAIIIGGSTEQVANRVPAEDRGRAQVGEAVSPDPAIQNAASRGDGRVRPDPKHRLRKRKRV
jgi:hypothetical protein